LLSIRNQATQTNLWIMSLPYSFQHDALNSDVFNAQDTFIALQYIDPALPASAQAPRMFLFSLGSGSNDHVFMQQRHQRSGSPSPGPRVMSPSSNEIIVRSNECFALLRLLGSLPLLQWDAISSTPSNVGTSYPPSNPMFFGHAAMSTFGELPTNAQSEGRSEYKAQYAHTFTSNAPWYPAPPPQAMGRRMFQEQEITAPAYPWAPAGMWSH
jgi:hypothetical protein